MPAGKKIPASDPSYSLRVKEAGYKIGAVTVAEYDPQAIEKKWQARWNAEHAFEADADPSKPKYYVLEMLPYPSGCLLYTSDAADE